MEYTCGAGPPDHDHIGFSTNPKLWKLLDANEKLIFADKIKKYTPCGWWTQDRTMVITSENIYNIKKDVVKRAIPITKLGGVSKSMLGSKTEFTFHVS